MSEAVVPQYLNARSPAVIPGLIAFWHFASRGERFPASAGEAYTLESHSGDLDIINDPAAPLGGTALRLREGAWLGLARAAGPRLDIHGRNGQLSLIAWIKRQRKSNGECEFIAGQWNESNYGRQYGLFLNIGVWQQADQVTGHLSNVGGPTPGYRYCIDGPVGATPVPRGDWSTVAMSYDGCSGYAWLNGALDLRPGLNPYPMAGGLHDGGPHGSDFTVGSVDRSGKMGNFFCGQIAGLAVYDRALTPAEMHFLAQL
jgi:hypothetical protein